MSKYYKECFKCGEINNYDAIFCSNCGSHIPRHVYSTSIVCLIFGIVSVCLCCVGMAIPSSDYEFGVYSVFGENLFLKTYSFCGKWEITEWTILIMMGVGAMVGGIGGFIGILGWIKISPYPLVKWRYNNIGLLLNIVAFIFGMAGVLTD